MFSAMQAFIGGALNRTVAPVSSHSTSPRVRSYGSDTYVQPPQSSDIPITLVPIPLYHSYGLNAFCFRSFAVPCTLLVIPKWDADLVLKLIPKYVRSSLAFPHRFSNVMFDHSNRWKISFLPLVPSMILQLVNSPQWEETDTSSIESTASGAALLPPDLSAKFQSKIKSNMYHGYGTSEAVRVPASFVSPTGSRETDRPVE